MKKIYIIFACVASFYLGGLAVRKYDKEQSGKLARPAMEAKILDILNMNSAQAVVVFIRPDNKIWVNWVHMNDSGALGTIEAARAVVQKTVLDGAVKKK